MTDPPLPAGTDPEEYDKLRRRVLWTMPYGLYLVGSRSGGKRQLMTLNWFSLENLGVLVRRHRTDDSVTRDITRILRASSWSLMDIGLLSVGADVAEGLYHLVDAAYERRSIALSSNLHTSGFDEIMPKTLATVDRLMHTPTSAPPAAIRSASSKPPVA